jgi:hypothetical protein
VLGDAGRGLAYRLGGRWGDDQPVKSDINTVKHGEVKYFRKNLPCIVTFLKLQGLLVNNRDFGSAIR